MKGDECRRLLAHCETRREWILNTIAALVRLESPTSDKAAVDRCGVELARRLEDQGGVVEMLPSPVTGDHLRATFGAGDGQLLLLGHLDTVWPVGQLARMPLREEDGRLHGPGVFDMKGGIAIGMLAVSALAEVGMSLSRRVVMLLTADEEHGSGSSRAIVETEARRSQAVCVLEPALPGGALKTSRKAAGEFEVEVEGVSAHAGLEPEKGASAISELGVQIALLDGLAAPERGVTVNVGVVEGGSRPNVVADRARALVDVRVETAADGVRIEEAIRGLRPRTPRTSVTVRGGFSRPPLERTASVVRLYVMARQVASELGRELGEGAAGGGSDGNLTAALSVPTLDGLGAVGDGAHALYEHIEVAELPWRGALVAGLLRRIDADAAGLVP